MKKIYKSILNSKQIKAAQMLANPEWDGNITGLCEEIGMTRATYYKWLGNSQFTDYVSQLIDKYADIELVGVWRSLLQKVKSGDMSAIKLYFELRAKNKPQNDGGCAVVILAGDDEIAK